MKANTKTTAIFTYVMIEDEGGVDIIRVRAKK